MPKKTTAEPQQQPADPELDAVQRVCRYFGRALALTIIAGKLELGHTFEDEAIAGMDEAWDYFGRALVAFARSTDA